MNRWLSRDYLDGKTSITLSTDPDKILPDSNNILFLRSQTRLLPLDLLETRSNGESSESRNKVSILQSFDTRFIW